MTLTSPPASRNRGFLDTMDGFAIPIVHVSARTARERGRQHGEAARAQIDASIEYYRDLFERSHSLGWHEIAERALVWEPIVRDFDPDLLEEAQGIADGARRSLGEILALNARGEMVYAQFLKAEGCTSFALLPSGSGTGRMYAGQNWDWRSGAKDSRIVLRIEQPPKPTITMIVEAGQLGRHGVNTEGIAVFANGLPASSSVPGVPQAVIRRRILDQPAIDRALDVVFEARQQIPANVLIAHRDGFAIDVETTPDGHRWAYPSGGVITHANHYEYFSGAGYQPRLGTDSLYRTFRMREGLERARGITDEGVVRQLIGDAFADGFGAPNSIAVHPDPAQPRHLQWETLSSSILDLTEGAWFVADGPSDMHPYRRLPWSLHDR